MIDWANLLCAPAVELTGAPSEPTGSAEFEWRDESGHLVAAYRREGGSARIDVVAVGTVQMTEAHAVSAWAVPGCEGALVDAFDRFARPVLAHALGAEVLHASAVRAGNGVVAFAGRSGAGKSTIALRLSERAFAPWADDTVVVQWRDDKAHALSLPFSFRVDDGVRSGRARDLPIADAPLSDVIALDDGDEPALIELGGAEAVRALVPQVFSFAGAGRVRDARVFAACTRLADTVRVWRLSAPKTPATIDFLEDALSG